METFITTVCTNDLGTPEITTCEYGGVLLYFPIVLFLMSVSGFVAFLIFRIMKKII